MCDHGWVCQKILQIGLRLIVFTERHIPRREAPASHVVRAVRHIQLLHVEGMGDRLQPGQYSRYGRYPSRLYHLRLCRHLVEIISYSPRRRRLAAPLIIPPIALFLSCRAPCVFSTIVCRDFYVFRGNTCTFHKL